MYIERRVKAALTPSSCHVYLEDIDPSILQEMRYTGFHNFIGRPIPGYKSARCIMTRAAALALKAVQQEAVKLNYTIKVYDAYRPQKAVDYFLAWCADATDDVMRTEFYPRLAKGRIVANPRMCRSRDVQDTADCELPREPSER